MTPEKLQELAEAAQKLRLDYLFDYDGAAAAVGLSCEAEQLFLLALSALEQAERYATLARYRLMKKM
jgi:hypothetical protein